MNSLPVVGKGEKTPCLVAEGANLWVRTMVETSLGTAARNCGSCIRDRIRHDPDNAQQENQATVHECTMSVRAAMHKLTTHHVC